MVAKKTGLAAAVWLAWSVAAQAQSLGFGAIGDAPLEIDADQGIEWQQAQQVYIARGNARAVQEQVSVTADTLSAYYRDGADGDTEFYRIDAQGNVTIRSEREVATAANAVYDVVNGVLVLTGDEVRLVTAEDTILARESIEYYENDRLAVARGKALAIRLERRVQADILMAHFGEGDSRADVKRIEAVGNVHISTPTDIVHADRGDYRLADGQASLVGNVRITRGENQLNGEAAEVDFNTGVSRLVSPSGQSRVRVLLVPGAPVPGQDGAAAAPARPPASVAAPPAQRP